VRTRIMPASVLLLLSIAIGLTLAHSPPTVARSDRTPLEGSFLKTKHTVQACQQHETLPAGVSAIRLSLYDVYGPRLSVKVLAGGHVIASGDRAAGWIGESPTVPLNPVSHASRDTKLCFSLGRPVGLAAIDGSSTHAAGGLTYADGHRVGGRMRTEYLKPGARSWWSLAPSIARRMGLGHWPAGTWMALPLGATIVVIAVSAAWLIARELR
jgi:hypothetical protein